MAALIKWIVTLMEQVTVAESSNIFRTFPLITLTTDFSLPVHLCIITQIPNSYMLIIPYTLASILSHCVTFKGTF